VVLSYTQRDFSTALSEKNQPAFWKAVWRFVAIVVVATPLFAVYDYVQVRSQLPFILNHVCKGSCASIYALPR
jgi:ABC-type uncharacterized transport system fused permease/ATPase subunit